jgi:hypothetical protein
VLYRSGDNRMKITENVSSALKLNSSAHYSTGCHCTAGWNDKAPAFKILLEVVC